MAATLPSWTVWKIGIEKEIAKTPKTSPKKHARISPPVYLLLSSGNLLLLKD